MPYPYLRQCDDNINCGKQYPGDLVFCPHCGAADMFSHDASMSISPLDYAYDIETYPNIFTCAVTHISSGTKWQFEISDRVNQINEFINFMFAQRDINARHVGFNNEAFDYPVVHFIVTNPRASYVDIYNKSQAVIKSRDPFEHSIWQSDRIVRQLDLYKMMHYNNKNKSTSLKHLEFNMRMDNIEDLPYPLGSTLDDGQKDILHIYNAHDVEATTRFYIRTLEHIKLREELTNEYKVDMTNFSNTKIGETILTTELEKAGVQCFDRSCKPKRPLQTIRGSIDLGETIFPYVKFDNPQFAFVKQFIANKTITVTKGAFHDIDVTDWPQEYLCFDKTLWPETFKVKKNNKGRIITTNLHVMVDGCLYVFGTGGLHMSIVSKDVHSDTAYQIVDVDVKSFYPKEAIENGMFPAHLGAEYCPIYDGIFDRRTQYASGTPLNKALKEALNASYGNSNNEHSPLYDPFYTMQTTINGQLLLCVLVEQLIKVPGLSMIQCNTDGVTYRVPREHIEHTRALCQWWEQLTCLELEEVLYSRMIIKNVNNYIACEEGSKVKRKGAYGYDKEWHQNASALIVPKAAEAHLLTGVAIDTFIREHKDPFDFCLKAKVPRSSKLMLEWRGLDVSLQLGNIIRYFISTSGGSLVEIATPKGKEGTWKRAAKVPDNVYNNLVAELINSVSYADAGGMIRYDHINDNWLCTETGKVVYELDADGTPHDPRIHTKNKSKHTERRSSKQAGFLITDCSDIKNFDWSSINYDYYIAEVHKLVDTFNA